MNKLLCKMFGHKWREWSVGTPSKSFGAIVVNLKTCERCDKQEHELYTVLDMTIIK